MDLLTLCGILGHRVQASIRLVVRTERKQVHASVSIALAQLLKHNIATDLNLSLNPAEFLATVSEQFQLVNSGFV